MTTLFFFICLAVASVTFIVVIKEFFPNVDLVLVLVFLLIIVSLIMMPQWAAFTLLGWSAIIATIYSTIYVIRS